MSLPCYDCFINIMNKSHILYSKTSNGWLTSYSCKSWRITSETNNGPAKSLSEVVFASLYSLLLHTYIYMLFFVSFCSAWFFFLSFFLQCFPPIVNSAVIFMCGRHVTNANWTDRTIKLQSVQFIFYTCFTPCFAVHELQCQKNQELLFPSSLFQRFVHAEVESRRTAPDTKFEKHT